MKEAQSAKGIGDFLEGLPRPAVLATLIKVTGSAPQEVGARMWVHAARFVGTLGGGEFERQVLEYARDMLEGRGDDKAHIKEYVLCRETGQCCGGRVEVFFEPVPKRRTVHLFGAGHVGRATASVLAQTGLDIHIIDERPDWLEADLPSDVNAHRIRPLEYARSKSWDEDDAVAVFTHSHDVDFELIRFFLEHPVGYIGLIGSEHKAEVFSARLKTRAGEALAGLFESKVKCPIGIPLESKNPKTIAVSIAAELLKEWALARSKANIKT